MADAPKPSATLAWWKDGKAMTQDDPRLAWARPRPVDTDPDPDPPPVMSAGESKIRTDFTTIVRGLCDQYDVGEIDVLLAGFVDDSGRPVPMIGPYPQYANTDMVALADLLHHTAVRVADQRLYGQSPPPPLDKPSGK